jgi:hypothetical protein
MLILPDETLLQLSHEFLSSPLSKNGWITNENWLGVKTAVTNFMRLTRLCRLSSLVSPIFVRGEGLTLAFRILSSPHQFATTTHSKIDERLLFSLPFCNGCEAL